VISIALFSVGTASLALTLYLWFGDWPQEAKETVDHYRSLAARPGEPPAPLISNARDRNGSSLNGRWQAVIDPYDRGGLGGLAPRAFHPDEPADHAEFSFEDGLTLRVPGDWNTQDPRLVFYQGVVWYKREFDHEPDPERRAFLWFGAANYRASVYLNGLLVGQHEGGFTPFNFEVTDSLRSGSNRLVIKVDNRHGDDDIPAPITDWLNHGGLTRDVLLLDFPRTFIRSWELQLDPSRPGHLRGWVQLDGAGRSCEVELSIAELEIQETLACDPSGRAPLYLEAAPERWSPENPKLYRVDLRSGDDAVSDRIGFRTIEAKGREIRLNGKAIFLRGVSLHEEAPGGGRANDPADADALLSLVRDLGANFARLAHYPHNEYIVRRADELGVLLWQEIPVYWDIDWSNPVTLERGKRQLSELIERDRNRASVIFWSIGNETPMGEKRQRFMGELAAHVKRLDATRLTTGAMLSGGELLGPFMAKYYLPALFGWSPGTWTFRVDDPLGDLVDVPALNEYFGWYYSGVVGLVTPFSSRHARRVMLENIPRIRLEFGVDKPIVVSEFGAGAKRGVHADRESFASYSEELQARVYEQQLAMLELQPEVAGISPWVLKDFRSPLRLYQGVQDYWNRKGLVDEHGEKKLSFGVLRDWYLERARQATPH
jgi:beta-glucuronidase